MRIDRIRALLPRFGIEALLIENPIDIFYLVGEELSVAQLIVTANGSSLLLDGRYFERFKNLSFCKVVLAEKDVLREILSGIDRLGFDSSHMTVDRVRLLQNSLPHIRFEPLSKPLKEFRAIKDAKEIAALKRAAHVTKEGYLEILKHLKEGVSEEELAFLFEMFCRKNGASKLSFEPIIAFGENSAYPHYRAGKARLKKNQIVLCDLGAVVDHYHADMTRVFFFGEPNPKLVRLFDLVKNSHENVVKEICPGKRVGDLHDFVKRFYIEEGVDALFPHGLGHGIGLEVHEFPLIRVDGTDRDVLLKPGMVFTIEPGLYLPGVGGVRYENTYAMTENGVENFYGNI